MEIEVIKRIFKFLEEKEEIVMPLSVKIKLGMPIAKEDLNVKGDLDLRRSNITSLPEGLEVGGSLNLSYTKITSLPKGLKVGVNLYLQNSKITSLPEGLCVGYSLYIHGAYLLKYTDDEIREMIKPGFIEEKILR